MASEASRKKAEALLAGSFVEHTEECQHALWDEPGCTCGREELRDEIAVALDEARAEGERMGAERERWECHRNAERCKYERASQASSMSELGNFEAVCAKASEAARIADAIASRGPMLAPEEGEE